MLVILFLYHTQYLNSITQQYISQIQIHRYNQINLSNQHPMNNLFSSQYEEYSSPIRGGSSNFDSNSKEHAFSSSQKSFYNYSSSQNNPQFSYSNPQPQTTFSHLPQSNPFSARTDPQHYSSQDYRSQQQQDAYNFSSHQKPTKEFLYLNSPQQNYSNEHLGRQEPIQHFIGGGYSEVKQPKFKFNNYQPSPFDYYVPNPNIGSFSAGREEKRQNSEVQQENDEQEFEERQLKFQSIRFEFGKGNLWGDEDDREDEERLFNTLGNEEFYQNEHIPYFKDENESEFE